MMPDNYKLLDSDINDFMRNFESYKCETSPVGRTFISKTTVDLSISLCYCTAAYLGWEERDMSKLVTLTVMSIGDGPVLRTGKLNGEQCEKVLKYIERVQNTDVVTPFSDADQQPTKPKRKTAWTADQANLQKT
jgi:hypothetical protein